MTLNPIITIIVPDITPRIWLVLYLLIPLFDMDEDDAESLMFGKIYPPRKNKKPRMPELKPSIDPQDPFKRIFTVEDEDVIPVSFTVSWISSEPKTGEVRHGLNSALGITAYDVRCGCILSTTHYVLISDLLPEVTYYFDVVTGGGVDNNGGVHYSFTTGPTIETSPGSDMAFGQVVLPDGSTPADGALVYITIIDDDGSGSSGQSSIISSIVELGYWYAQLANARLSDMSGPFERDM